MKQQYSIKPVEIEVYKVFDDKTDVILRKDIQQEQRERMEDKDKASVELIWTCEEIQSRFNEPVTKEEIEKDFNGWWRRLEKNNKPVVIPTTEDRLQALESAMLTMMYGG